ncbi:hypothetical protein MPH_09673 [Macrophomina phaseolina MS6]|uniref:Uncharacterized protein n=1 Tax=Macrophomina phaseolina (strain MS6) TaxID=1126212 RepID=K2QTW5_MACPH|nr:hypothetical protein MPH_09673 [Macrophomina phaseolina MS6]
MQSELQLWCRVLDMSTSSHKTRSTELNNKISNLRHARLERYMWGPLSKQSQAAVVQSCTKALSRHVGILGAEDVETAGPLVGHGMTHSGIRGRGDTRIVKWRLALDEEQRASRRCITYPVCLSSHPTADMNGSSGTLACAHSGTYYSGNWRPTHHHHCRLLASGM